MPSLFTLNKKRDRCVFCWVGFRGNRVIVSERNIWKDTTMFDGNQHRISMAHRFPDFNHPLIHWSQDLVMKSLMLNGHISIFWPLTSPYAKKPQDLLLVIKHRHLVQLLRICYVDRTYKTRRKSKCIVYLYVYTQLYKLKLFLWLMFDCLSICLFKFIHLFILHTIWYVYR